ncbi:MAG: hypothetical protein FJ247_00275 [Nitrospira sp.]|nr:hypothetical protein [Nitrospira sp.]
MKRSSPSRGRVATIGIVAVLALICAACGGPKRSQTGPEPIAGTIPLTPALWLSPSATTAGLSYRDACGKSATIPLADPLAAALSTKLGRVFSAVLPQQGTEQIPASDSLIEVGLGPKKVDLAIPGQVKGTYPATVTLGMELVVLAQDGTFLFNEKRQGSSHGQVEVSGQSCDVQGLEPIVQEAIDAVVDDVVRRVAASARIREYAAYPKAFPPTATSASQAAGGISPLAPAGMSPEASSLPTTGQPVLQGGTPQATALSFHAIVRDENQDHLLQQDETLTIEVEVKNEGRIEANGVEVLVGGALMERFPPTVAVGTVKPGEIKRVSISHRVTQLKAEAQGEVVLSLRSATALLAVPPLKRFTLQIKPEKAETAPVQPDVDHVPKPLVAAKQAKSLVIAIGVGKFRDARVPTVKYAERDAEVMSGYLRAIGGVPPERTRLLVDQNALKEDLAETFEEWLPKRVDADTVVYVYFSGRALVDGMSGAVSLVPFDGTTGSIKRLYPVRRMQQVLSKLPIQRAIMIFEVSLDPTPGSDPALTPQADWEDGLDEGKNEVMWMVGNKALQEAHAYEQGKHGLFTYFLLRGLQGLADIDRDGTVVAGELCTYARGEVGRVARQQFGNAQHPLCSPPPGHGAVIRIHPMARGNNPKPVAPEKHVGSTATPHAPPAFVPKQPEVGPRP